MSRSIFLSGALLVLLAGCGSSKSSQTKVPEASKAPQYEVFRFENSPASSAALTSYKAGEYYTAANQAAQAVDADHTDMIARYLYGASLVMIGDYERARKQLSLALAWYPRIADAYPRRAVCAAWMGDEASARRDMEIARQLDSKDVDGVQKWAEEKIREVLKHTSSANPAALSKDLFKAADSGKPYAELQEIADELLKASNANRFIGDETYAENCRKLDWYLAENPEDPDRYFRFGRFLIDEMEVQEHYVQSNLSPDVFRMQGRFLRTAEIERAKGLLQKALQLDPNHVGALIGMGNLEMKLTLWANAENYLRRAMAVGTPDPEVLYMMRNLMAIASGQQMARSMALTQVRTWEEKIGNYVYKYTSYPTAEAYRQAGQHDQAADRMMNSSVDFRNAIIAMNADDARVHDYIAVLANQYQDYESAERGWKRALELDPGNHLISYSLADVYARQNRVDDYLKQATKTWCEGRHTSAAHYLRWAWNQINLQNWNEAEKALKTAIEVDAGDSRAFAYLGVVAESKGDTKTAKSYYKATFALEQAHARLSGASFLEGSGRWYPNDLGLALEMRMRLGLLSEDEGKIEDALSQYRAIYNLETKIGDGALVAELYNAMLPVPGNDYKTRPHPPRWGEMMRTSRALAGYLFYNQGNLKEAAEQFGMLRNFDNRKSAAGGKGYQYLQDTVWKAKPVAEAAYEVFKRLNDQSQVHWWEREARRFDSNPPKDWRRNQYAQPPEWSSNGKLKIKG
ncbi:MAG: tetratricopeptide repeat protein [Verrucomicrobiae bacterium]|nr:tetratricopeptide repeat protein [Verrucomicrobiae bacterium]